MKYGAWPAGAGSVYRSRAFELDSNVRAPFPPWARLLGLLRADLDDQERLALRHPAHLDGPERARDDLRTKERAGGRQRSGGSASSFP